MKIVIAGVGLIGGSFALALKNRKDLEFAGFDKSDEVLREAEGLGITFRSFTDITKAIEWADLILLTVPVDAIKEMLPDVLDQLEEGKMVVDFGSTKATICEAIKNHPRRDQFIAAHPIAGTEHSGPQAAFPSLFQEKNLILCDVEESDHSLLATFEDLALAAGFYITRMDSAEHDRHLAYISHLSHITSYVLSNTVLQKEKDGEVILDLAGSGFESTVRLAKSSPAMWSSIFMENKEMVLQGIDAYKKELERLEAFIQDNKQNEVFNYLDDGRVIRKILK